MSDNPKTADFEHLLSRRNIVAVSLDADTDSLDVWVSQKLPLAALDAEDVVANNVPAGVTTDVHDAGMGEEADGFTPELLTPEDDALFSLHANRHVRHRPVLPGVSEINARSTAATSGHYPARVTDPSKGVWDDSIEKGDLVRISNCHVYARSGQADLGESIVQPSPYDGGDGEDTTGGLVGYLLLEDGVRADVAARSVDPVEDTVEPHEMDAEWPTAIRRGPPEKGAILSKTGRTTGVTSGRVLAPAASVRVRYPHGVVTLHEQVLTEAMSAGGDSGSPVYDAQGRLTAQLFAGSPKITAHNRVDAIESDFGIQLMNSEPNEHESEQDFESYVETLLEEEYGADNVYRQYTFSIGKRADFIVVDADHDQLLCYELENDAGSLWSSGQGQAKGYATIATLDLNDEDSRLYADIADLVDTPTDLTTQAVLCFPEGHIYDDERSVYDYQGIQLREVDVPADVSIEGV